MDLIFEKKEQYFGKDAAWVSEFEVAADFNLHVERISGGRFLVYQKSVADGEYDLVDGLGYKDHKDTIDMDFVALVYPKWIKVVSEAEVTMGIVTFTGDAPSGGGETQEDPYKYINFLSVGRDDRDVLRKYISEYSENGLVFPTVEAAEQYGDTSSPTYAKIDFNAVVSYDGTIKDMLMNNDGWSEDKITSLPYVTREEFYNLNA